MNVYSLYKMNKMFCKRTKKRKVQRELDILDNWTMDLFPDKLDTTFDTTPVQETFSNSIPTSTVNSSFNSNCSFNSNQKQ